MCGIAGSFDNNGDSEKLVNAVTGMVKCMQHRGPDYSGLIKVSNSPTLVLGHARLSIIDLSSESNQPMIDKACGNTIVFNGEIYNFEILRCELESHGHVFYTKSDTEVILKSYNQWGSECTNKLRGIFAFAIWDSQKKQLFMARDSVGVKPFYYWLNGGRLIFASEVRAILASGLVPKVLDPDGLDSYLAYGSVQEPFTLIKGIHSLSPGYFATFEEAKGFIMTKYSESLEKTITLKGSEEEYTEMVHQTLKETIKLQMISDVPLGIFLSGGIDSSAIVSLVRQVHGGEIKTFSISFEDPKFDESTYARKVSHVNGTNHTELNLTSAIIMDNLVRAMDSYDQPSIDGMNTWFVSKLAREAGLTVAMSGVGGDELFVGYGGFDKALTMQKVQPIMSHLPKFFGTSIQYLSSGEKLRKVGDLAGFRYPGYFISRKVFSSVQRKRILNKDYRPEGNWFNECYSGLISESMNIRDELTRISLYELRTYMMSTLLRDTDQMSMAHSLEVRVPLIDPEVVRLMLSIPGKYKKKGIIPKPLLVASGSKGIPPECIYRKKQGFTFPFDQYFMECLGRDIEDFFKDTHNRILNRKEIYNLWNSYQKGWISWSRIWGLFVLEWWLRLNKIEH